MTAQEILGSVSEKKREDALWLLCALLKKNRSEILLNPKIPLGRERVRRWRAWWRRRMGGEPLQYVSGFAPFWGRDFQVNRNVLIPRPETEVLVELALDLFRGAEPVSVLDIGTGSGCIALTLKAERPHWQITATDLSPKALAIAKKNASAIGLSVSLERHDLFSEALRERGFDLVVSNPPYLDFSRDWIASDVKKWEPRAALEPAIQQKIPGIKDRAAWCANRILLACVEARPRYSVLELSPRVAANLERRWRSHSAVERAWRAPDLAGRKRFLLIAWKSRVA